MKHTTSRFTRPQWRLSLIAAAATLCVMPQAQAVQINTDNPDLAMTLDTTVRYNAAWRTSERDMALVNTNTDEGNFLFNKRDLVLSRVDLFSEFDLTWKQQAGLRISASAWYDNNFPDKGRSAPAFAGAPNYANNNFTPYVTRYYQGPSGEFGDAFVWGNFNLGSTQMNVKAGRFAWLPGEFLLGNGGSASFSMAPSDGRKSDLSPGASAKETALPIGQVAVTWQLNPEISLLTQVTGEFRTSRISEGGTFFQVSDVALEGPQFVSNPAVPRKESFKGGSGDISLGLKWQPHWAEGDAFGLWVRRFDDKNPTWSQQVQINNFAASPTTGRLARAVYAKDIELFGLTYNTVLGGWGTGVELNMRRNMPLASTGTFSTIASPGLIVDPELEGARGTTVHALLSGALTLNKNKIFDSGVIALQVDYTRLQSITKNQTRFNGAMSGVAGRCANEEIIRGCSTRQALSIGGNFTPTWQQALPSVDISLPVTLLYGIKGNAAAVGAGTVPEGSYLLRIGARAEYLVSRYKHQFDLSYTQRDGKAGTAGGAQAFSGFANFRDRNYLSFTYQTAF
jgi:hypothetical protein